MSEKEIKYLKYKEKKVHNYQPLRKNFLPAHHHNYSINNDWQAFAGNMLEAINITQSIPSEFFNHFYWDNIAKKAAAVVVINEL